MDYNNHNTTLRTNT